MNERERKAFSRRRHYMAVGGNAFLLLLFVGASALLLAGCGSKMTREKAMPVTVSLVDRPAFDAAIAQHRGKVVLVDFWATWCLPCVEQLPHTLELGRKMADRGLAVVTVSCDEPSDSERVAELLRSKDAGGATNLISQFGVSAQTMETFEIMGGAVPFYQLYDRTGKLRQTFGVDPTAAKQFTAADIDAAIELLLTE
jgi:thiol-disulfide isomerase/thioredoxin